MVCVGVFGLGDDRTWAMAIFMFLKIVLVDLLGLRRMTETSLSLGRHTEGMIHMLSVSRRESKFSIRSGVCESEYAMAFTMHCDSGGRRMLVLAITNMWNGEP